MNDGQQLVRQLPFLRKVDEKDLRALGEKGSARHYKAGSVVFREGDPGDSLHLVLDGSIRLTVLSRGGEEITVALVGPGESLGDLSLLDGLPRSATATVFRNARTFVVTRADFLDWLVQRPRSALALLEALSLRFRRKEQMLTDFIFFDLTRRLACQLIDLTQTVPEVRPEREGDAALVRITQGELASMLGVSRQSVNKELNAFADRGWIALGRGSVSVRNPTALTTFALGD